MYDTYRDFSFVVIQQCHDLCCCGSKKSLECTRQVRYDRVPPYLRSHYFIFLLLVPLLQKVPPFSRFSTLPQHLATAVDVCDGTNQFL
jgi:hypothetical protein